MARVALAGGVAREAWAVIRSVVAGVSGEGRYAAYLDHARRAHPEREPLGRAAFWREHYRWQDANPEAGCC